MSIQIVDNFKLNLAAPIDTRMVTNGQLSRNSIKYTYEGLRVYDIFEKTPYVWLDGTWQKESSVTSVSASSVSAVGGGSTPPPTVVTTNRIVKYTNSTTIGEGSIFDKGIFINPSVGIGKIPATGIALEVLGMVKATTFIGTISGNNLDIKSIDYTKIKPHNVNSGEFALKTIGSQVVWTSTPSLNLNIVITNETLNTNTHYLLFSSTSNTTTGVPIYANNVSTSRLIGIKPSTSQILASGDTTNNKSAPGYAFSGTTNDTSGLYGNTSEVGLSFKNNALLKLSNTMLSIFDISGIEVLKTGTNKVIFTNGGFNGTLSVTGKATLSSLKVNTGTTTFFSMPTVDLTILTGGSATINNLIVGSTTTFTSLNITSLTVGAKLTTKDFDCTADYSNPAVFNSLTITTTLNVLDPDGFNNLVGFGPGYSASLQNVNVNGVCILNTITQPLTILGDPNSPYNNSSISSHALKIVNLIQNQKKIISYSNIGDGKFKSVNLIGTGVNLSGTLYCSKLRFGKTNDTIRNTLAFEDWWANSSGTLIGGGLLPLNGLDGVWPPPGDYKPGDIIFLKWLQPAQTNVWSATLNKYVNIAKAWVGRHFFYCGSGANFGYQQPGNFYNQYCGWRLIEGNANEDPFLEIKPNPDPYAGTIGAHNPGWDPYLNTASPVGGNAGTGANIGGNNATPGTVIS